MEMLPKVGTEVVALRDDGIVISRGILEDIKNIDFSVLVVIDGEKLHISSLYSHNMIILDAKFYDEEKERNLMVENLAITSYLAKYPSGGFSNDLIKKISGLTAQIEALIKENLTQEELSKVESMIKYYGHKGLDSSVIDLEMSADIYNSNHISFRRTLEKSKLPKG